MEFDNLELSVIDDGFNSDIDFDISLFDEIINIINFAFLKIGISSNDKSIFYQRYQNGMSMLAIKLMNGADDDKTIYMFNGADASYFRDSHRCDVYLHANAKCAQLASRMANLISKDIVKFFNDMEEYLLNNYMNDLEFSIRIPLVQNKNVEKESGVKRLINKFFKR